MRLSGLLVAFMIAHPALGEGANDAVVTTDSVDIRAFGDSGYVGGLGVYGTPPADWVRSRLSKVEMLRSLDINFLNLEGSLTRSCDQFDDKPFPFAISPEALTDFGRWGFNLISLANNHTLDCLDPAPGLESARALDQTTKEIPGLRAHGIAASLKNLINRPALLTVRNVKIGMVSMKAWETGRRATIGNLNNRGAVMGGLAKADVDIRILSLHGGIENSRRPTVLIMNLAREFVAKYDGDIVFAHHPHVSQGFEVITKPNGRHAVIFYSLGNGLHNGLSPNGDGLAARVRVRADGIDLNSLAVFPLRRPSFKPRALVESELPEITETLRASSAAIALRPLPRGLGRVAFELELIRDPALGLQLDFVPGAIGAGKSVAPQVRNVAIKKTPKDRSRGRSDEPGSRKAAEWIAPPTGVPHILKESH